jgi:glycosyltransferase involved in cell wall biosynthesis
MLNVVENVPSLIKPDDQLLDAGGDHEVFAQASSEPVVTKKSISPMEPSALSIIMPCYNRAHDLERVLRAYDIQNADRNFEIIAVDDASTDETYKLLTSYCPSHYTLRIARQERNQGQGAARNRAIPLVNSPLVLFVGDDISPEPDFVQRHLEAHYCYPEPEVTILGHISWPLDLPKNTLMEHIDGRGAQQFSYFYFKDGQEYDFRHFYTSNLSLKTTFLKQVSPPWFDPIFTRYGFEDAELGYRLARLGLRIIYTAKPKAYHYHYHTIWSFSKRQYNSGLMACVLADKHPELARFFRITKTKYLIALALFQRLNSNRPPLAGVAAWLEEQILHLTSYYEWYPHPLLDELYLAVLDHFWRKGLIDGVFRNSAYLEEVRNSYTIYYLGTFLRNFLPKASRLNIPVPTANIATVEAKLVTVESPMVKRLLALWKTKGFKLMKPWLYPNSLPS